MMYKIHIAGEEITMETLPPMIVRVRPEGWGVSDLNDKSRPITIKYDRYLYVGRDDNGEHYYQIMTGEYE